MVKKILKYLLFSILGFILFVLLMLLAPAVWRHWITYPQLEKQGNKFQKLRKEPASLTKLNTYRGVLHVHSYLSHDSKGTLYDIIPAAKIDGIDFIFLTDHPHGDIDTFPHGYKGYYEGVLIEPGSEKQGFDTWPLDSTIINWKVDKDTIAKNIVSRGGIIFYAHTEEPHNWANPYYQGMEIYNFHTDTKDESLPPQIINFIVNGNKYRQWALREMFDEQTSILALWDSLNIKRKIVGFSAVDTHENQNIRARYLKDGRVEWVGPNANVIDTMEVKFWNRWLLHQPDEDGWIFKWMIDTYKSGFNYITNYVLADTLSVPSLADHLKMGHLYTAFKSLGDAKGFMYYCMNQDDSIGGILGDSIKMDQVKTLNAVSPLPGQFRLIHDGKTVNVSSDDNYQYTWEELIEKGAYRIEMHIKLKEKYVPWLYSNPIYIY
ncbi:MAG: PHP domain-containing protein [Bacteroidales bacterium]